jgi:hypothetical protein
MEEGAWSFGGKILTREKRIIRRNPFLVPVHPP